MKPTLSWHGVGLAVVVVLVGVIGMWWAANLPTAGRLPGGTQPSNVGAVRHVVGRRTVESAAGSEVTVHELWYDVTATVLVYEVRRPDGSLLSRDTQEGTVVTYGGGIEERIPVVEPRVAMDLLSYGLAIRGEPAAGLVVKDPEPATLDGRPVVRFDVPGYGAGSDSTEDSSVVWIDSQSFLPLRIEGGGIRHLWTYERDELIAASAMPTREPTDESPRVRREALTLADAARFDVFPVYHLDPQWAADSARYQYQDRVATATSPRSRIFSVSYDDIELVQRPASDYPHGQISGEYVDFSGKSGYVSANGPGFAFDYVHEQQTWITILADSRSQVAESVEHLVRLNVASSSED